MGAENTCRLVRGGRALTGRALLETDELVFRGDERVRVPLRDVVSALAQDGVLVVRTRDEELRFEVGEAVARRWAQRITDPPSLLDKLGIKPALRVSVAGVRDDEFAAQLAARDVQHADDGADVLLLGIDERSGLQQVPAAWSRVAAGGALWIVYPKGVQAVTENDVLAAGRAAGLLDVKVARFSATHTALRFVAPRARR